MTSNTPQWLSYSSYHRYSPAEMGERADQFERLMTKRRTIRDYQNQAVPEAVIRACIRTAGSAPSGANMQPWHFCVISDAGKKHEIRLAAEAEEQEFYSQKAPPEWLEALAPLGTDADKSFLENATLIAIFAERFGSLEDGRRVKHYYVPESVGIATGFLIAALHNAGLATLTHTPSPMTFLNRICQRPDNERPYLLLVCGYPSKAAKVPVAGAAKKPLEMISSWF
ncbi:MAG: nitroreductase family protein [Rhodospirillales bacterium]|nr:nitroreductase family protein [Rhodospirillales bacterium]